MSWPCQLDPSCVCWTPPEPLALCCDCLDLEVDPETGEPVAPDDMALFMEAWAEAVSYLYPALGCAWPGCCWTEEVRPCVRQKCPSTCRCQQCNIQEIPLDTAFCLPICEILQVKVWSPCAPEGEIWTPGDGFRVERRGYSRRPFLVIEDGCCSAWPQQDLCSALGENCTWSIVARTGCNPPLHVLRAAATLATEIARECVKTGCTPPAGARTVTRRNTVISLDEGDSLGHGVRLKILDRLIEGKDIPKRAVEGFADPTCPVSFHSVSGPDPAEPHEHCGDLLTAA